MTSAKLYIYIGVGSRDLFIDEAHTELGIFLVFSLHAAYSALRLFLIMNELVTQVIEELSLLKKPRKHS